jgi:hypothetical protein
VVVGGSNLLSDSQTSLSLFSLVGDESSRVVLSVLEVVDFSDDFSSLVQVVLVFWVHSLGLADKFLSAVLLDRVGPLETFRFSVDIAPFQTSISLSQGTEFLVWLDFVGRTLVHNLLVNDRSIWQFLDDD